jgi:DNA-binding CsgD family transcriptional regulator
MLSPFLDSWIAVICFSVAGFCFVLFQSTHMVTLSELVNEEHEDAVTTLLVSMFIVTFGMLIGWAAGCLLLIFWNYEGELYRYLIAVFASLLVASLAYQGRPGKNAGTVLHIHKSNGDSFGRRKRACLEIADAAGLSERQKEVFQYLAKGRNAFSIAKELVVSEHTIKAHIYRIYQKLEVHSQQELIDIVEKHIGPSPKLPPER